MKFKITFKDGRLPKYNLEENEAMKIKIENPGSILSLDDEEKKVRVSSFDVNQKDVKDFILNLTASEKIALDSGKKKISHNKENGFFLKRVQADKDDDSEIRISTEAAKNKRQSEVFGLLKSVLESAVEMDIHPDYSKEELMEGIKKLFRK
jgi:hypothetical protein